MFIMYRVICQRRGRVFHPISKNREMGWKDVAQQSGRVFQQISKKPRSGLKNRGAAKIFKPTSSCL